MTFLADPAATSPIPPRFAFALPRKVGNAVQRNRVRRVVQGRLLGRVGGADAHTVAGAYLVAVRPTGGDTGATVVADHVDVCLDELWTSR